MLKFPTLNWKKSIFFRLVMTYLVVSIPIVILGLYLYVWSYKNTSDNLLHATQTNMQHYIENIHREIEWMELQQYELLHNNEINKLAVTWELLSNEQRRDGLYYILQKLHAIHNSSNYITDIEVHLLSINKSISTSYSVHDLDKEYYQERTNTLKNMPIRLSVIDEKLRLFTFKYGGLNYVEPLYLIEFHIHEPYLASTLEQLNLYPGSESFLYIKEPFYVINGDDKSNAFINSLERMSNQDIPSKKIVNLENLRYQLLQASSSKLGINLVTFLPAETLNRPLSFFSVWAWLFAVALLISVIIVYYTTYQIIHVPLLQLVQSFKRIEAGELNIPIKHNKEDEFGYLYGRFNHMLEKLNELIEQDYKQKMMMQKSELKQLQSQINPHFLYNSFFILNSLAKIGDVERIEQFTVMLGEYFRFITRNGEDLVSLSEEVKHCRMYTEIQGLRFSRRIRVCFEDLPEHLSELKVPRLFIQPIVENAYEHSLEKKDENGILHITFTQQPLHSLIIIEDNGEHLSDNKLLALQQQLKNVKDAEEVTGMLNIHRRLQLTFGLDSGLMLERSKLGGLKVVIQIQHQAIQ